ncbi:MAG: serine/threonine-protein kinase [Vicinamibacterales bacterium]
MNDSVDPVRWQRVEALFEAVADLSPEARSAELERLAAGDAALVAEVSRLLAHDESRGARLAAILADVARLPPIDEPADAGLAGPDRRIGPYRVLRELGRGGMGVVYEGVRDDEFQQRVALKVAARSGYAPELLARFRDERQILARLSHPHIARLIDGGTTGDGVPWFAMEFVEGEPIDRYVGGRAPGLDERIALFLQVCGAVEYAHQNLVVHRDLKPANVLVADGAVRLLDFGVAKLLAAPGTADAALTRGGLAPVTPDYCSPEQLRGEPVTTRTDVYSLGLLLYEVLTGVRGQRADTTSPLALERSICEVPVGPPSAAPGIAGTWARRLRGDLDTIVATATRKEPARRSASVAALAADLRRHLDGRPITARLDSPWYRVRRFTRRHWLPLGAAAALVATLAAGVVAAGYQARRAERRFQQVRAMARALMNDVHAAIQDLPSSTAAQQTVLTTAVEYLDGLVGDAGDDRALQVEIARGYLKASEMAYSLERPSLGRLDEGRRYLERATAILQPLESGAAADPAVAAAVVERLRLAADLALAASQRDAALALLRRAAQVGQEALATTPDDVELLGVVHATLVGLLSTFNTDAWAAAQLPRLVELAEHRVALQPDVPEARAQLAVAYSQAGNVASTREETVAARQYYQRSVELQSAIVAAAPDNATARRNLMIALANVADLALGPLGGASYTGAGGPPRPLAESDRRVAYDAATQACAQAAWLLERDPANDTAGLDYAVCRGRMAPTFAPGDPQAAPVLADAIARLQALAARHPARVAAFEIEFRGSLAERHRQAGRMAGAEAEWRRIDEIVRRGVRDDPADFYLQRLAIPPLENQALALAASGRRAEARRVAARVEQLAAAVNARADVYARAPGGPPRVRAWHAALFAMLGDEAAARSAREDARVWWQAVAARTDVPDDLKREARAAIEGTPAP